MRLTSFKRMDAFSHTGKLGLQTCHFKITLYFILLSSATPRLASSDKPDVDRISSSSVTVRWPGARNITSGLETHYYYTVWIKAEGGSYKDMSKQPHTSSTDRFESHITGLQFNTHYSVKVEPYRQQNELSETGTSTGVTTFKTLCIGEWE